MSTHKLISKVIITSGSATSILFSSIPQNYTDLFLYGSYRGTVTNADNWRDVRMNINGAGYGTSINGRYLFYNGSFMQAGTASTIAGGVVVPSGATANTFSQCLHFFGNYSSTTLNKSFNAEFISKPNTVNSMWMMYSGIWSNTAAITSIEISPDSGSFAQYSSAYLYGITKA